MSLMYMEEQRPVVWYGAWAGEEIGDDGEVSMWSMVLVVVQDTLSRRTYL